MGAFGGCAFGGRGFLARRRELAGAPEVEQVLDLGDQAGDAAEDEDGEEGGERAVGQGLREGGFAREEERGQGRAGGRWGRAK